MNGNTHLFIHMNRLLAMGIRNEFITSCRHVDRLYAWYLDISRLFTPSEKRCLFSFRKYTLSRMALRTCSALKVLIRKASATTPSGNWIHQHDSRSPTAHATSRVLSGHTFIHSSDGGTECRGYHPEQFHQFRLVHPNVGNILRHNDVASSPIVMIPLFIFIPLICC